MGRQNPAGRDKVYRLSLVDNNTHNNIRTVRFTKMRFIYGAVSAVVLFVLLIYCLIAFTPLRTTIPGYPDAHSKKTAVANAIKIDSLESAITRWNLYATNLSRVLMGESTVDFDSLVRKAGDTDYLSAKTAEELSRQDSLLRETVRKEEQFGLSATSQRSLPVEGMHFFTPVKGVVSQGFDSVTHPWVELAAPAGTVVGAVLDGSVIFSGWDETLGYVVILQHKDDVVSIYGNNRQTLCSPGQEVKAGTPVAIAGSLADDSSGGSLHFELWHDGRRLDPTKYISF